MRSREEDEDPDEVLEPPACPVCGNPLGESARPPFCSMRCKAIDLGAWLDGSYHLPGLDLGEDDEEL
ncbi:MAG: DNA gyrase inhibitor YacG [Planctomycetota bacterium]